MEDKKKGPSFPSNYVTLAQLQERWQKRKEDEQQRQEEDQKRMQKFKGPKQMQDQKSVAAKAEPSSESLSQSQSQTRFRRRVKGKASVTKEVEVVGGHGADQVGEGEEKAGKKKEKKNKKNWKGKKPSLTAEKEVTGEGVLAAETLASVEKEDAPAGGKQERKGEAKAEKDSLDQTINVEPRSKILFANGGIGKGNGRLRGNGEKKNRERRGNRGKARAENGDLDQMANTEPKFTALSVDGGNLKVNAKFGENGEKNDQESRGTGSETRAEGNSLDQTADIEPKFRALSVNGLLGKRNDGLKGNGEKRNRSGGTNREARAASNNLDQTAHVEPEFRAFSANHWIDKGYNGLRRRGAYHSHGYWEFGRLGHRAVQDLRDGKMVWVKKGEVSDGNGCEH